MILDVSKMNLSTKLSQAISSVDEFVHVTPGTGVRFKPLEGTEYYATLYAGTRREIVRVTGAAGDTLHVVRGEDHTLPLDLPGGTCFIVEWNPAQLCAFVQTCVSAEKPVMAPGTYCLECNTCIEVDAYGRIIKIDGVEKC